MPELPEVECLTLALRPLLENQVLHSVQFYRKDLRVPIPQREFKIGFLNQPILKVSRRSKYMLWHTQAKIGIFHLGMSGWMLRQPTAQPVYPHTHAVFEVGGAQPVFLHYIDPRRFGMISICDEEEFSEHQWFRHLGPEPLLIRDLGAHFYARSRQKRVPLKSFIMDAKNVVGVGNIYANEALYSAKLHPLLPADRLDQGAAKRLALEIRRILRKAIRSGGTTLKDFKKPDGTPGYFRIDLQVYGLRDEPCGECGQPIKLIRLSNRATYFCENCQGFLDEAGKNQFLKNKNSPSLKA